MWLRDISASLQTSKYPLFAGDYVRERERCFVVFYSGADTAAICLFISLINMLLHYLATHKLSVYVKSLPLKPSYAFPDHINWAKRIPTRWLVISLITYIGKILNYYDSLP